MPKDRHDFETYPAGMPMDETDVNLRAYFANMDEEKILQYDPSWSDKQLVEWDGNFKDEGALMLICTERDVEVDEYRKVLEQYLEFHKTLGV